MLTVTRFRRYSRVSGKNIPSLEPMRKSQPRPVASSSASSSLSPMSPSASSGSIPTNRFGSTPTSYWSSSALCASVLLGGSRVNRSAD